MKAFQAHLLWDVTKAEFTDIRANLDGGRITGVLSVSLRGNRPTYRLEARAKDVAWKSGKVDAESVLESSGTGAELLARLHATGTFVARGVEMEALPDLESVSGAYDLVWAQAAPLLRFTELQLVSGPKRTRDKARPSRMAGCCFNSPAAPRRCACAVRWRS